MTTFNDILKLHKSIKYPHFSGVKTGYNDVLGVLNTLSPEVESAIVGHSMNGRAIHRLDWGVGHCKIVLWSQMHGNEGTSTRSLIDVLQFLTSDHTPTPLREFFAQHFHFILLPMLNPDGADRWQRENALGIDINRDARRFTTLEAQHLRDLLLHEQPNLCFNLHDQSVYYAAGNTHFPATITLLAPPIDEKESSSTTHHEAVRLVEHLYEAMQSVLPSHTAKWNDDYEPRAFGEWAQIHIAPTLLIEAGGYPNDPSREVARSLQFALILYAVLMHQKKGVRSSTLYNSIPLNRSEGIFDHIERGVTIEHEGQHIVTDKGVRENEVIIGDLADDGSFSEIRTEAPWL